MKKSVIALALSVIVCLGMAACDNTTPDSDTTRGPRVAPVVTPAPRTTTPRTTTPRTTMPRTTTPGITTPGNTVPDNTTPRTSTPYTPNTAAPYNNTMPRTTTPNAPNTTTPYSGSAPRISSSTMPNRAMPTPSISPAPYTSNRSAGRVLGESITEGLRDSENYRRPATRSNKTNRRYAAVR